jgi:hypothetical protein
VFKIFNIKALRLPNFTLEILYANKILIALIAVKLIYSFYIPINIIPGSPHDDFLFYRLGENIANLSWLGEYQNTTLIKGFSYPSFIAISILLHIPLRILEALLVCFSAIYFIGGLNQFGLKNWQKYTLISLIFFYPYQYGLIDFRILRDMVYPQITLIVFSSFLWIYKFKDEKFNKITLRYIFGFSIAYFLFNNTREEGVWIVPALLLSILIVCHAYWKVGNLKTFFKYVMVSLVIIFTLHIFQLTIDYISYKSTVTNTFKDKNFQEGYGSLHRLAGNKLLYNSVTNDEWEQFFKISPTALELKKYITGDAYHGWVLTGCHSLRGQQKDIALSGCDEQMPVGYLMFSLLDALWDAGYQTPDAISSFMGRLSSEIDDACKGALLNCVDKPKYMMPPRVMSGDIPMDAILLNIKKSLYIVQNFHNRPLGEYKSTEDYQNTLKIRKKIQGYIFSPQIKINKSNNNHVELQAYSVGNVSGGYSDGITYENGILSIYGWAYIKNQDKFTDIVATINGYQFCQVAPNISRGDINPESPEGIGFLCAGKYNLQENQNLYLDIYALNEHKKIKYKLSKTELVQKLSDNQFDERCYIDSNPDVKSIVEAGKITAIEHWKAFGMHEKRNCMPLFNDRYEKNFANIEKYSLPGDSLVSKIFDINDWIYKIIINPSIFIIIISTFAALIFGFYQLIFINLVFTTLLISRIMLMAILDYVGLAPISPNYLTTAVYFNFLICLISFLIIMKSIDSILNKFKRS